MKHILLSISLILGATAVSADIKSTPSIENYFEETEIKMGEQIICEEKISIGFNWQNGNYRQINYQKEAYLFTKQEHRDGVEHECQGLRGSLCTCPNYIDTEEDSIWISEEKDTQSNSRPIRAKRCYLVEENDGFKYSTQCTEYYNQSKLIKVNCDKGHLIFHPNQLFLKIPSITSQDVSLFPENGYKDSFVISHGTCRVKTY